MALDTRSRDRMDPFISAMLDAKETRVSRGPYQPLSDAEVASALTRLLGARGQSGFSIENISRMSGGASKEQFSFTFVRSAGNERERMVLRMDPVDGVLETSRQREVDVLALMEGRIPVPQILFADITGEHLGAPGIVVSFVNGVTKPVDASSGVSGLGTGFSEQWRERLAPQFIDNLVKIHATPLSDTLLSSYGVPREDPRDAALWQVNHWSRVWRTDAVSACPLVAVVEQWLRDNLPSCSDPVLVHGDYRTGNYLFDPDGGEVTAVLDWELAHVGDFHQDLALSLVELFGTQDADGRRLCSSLMTRDELISRYETASGRTVDPDTLRFYHILSAWSLLIMGGATGLRAATAQHNHQDILLTWLSMVAHPLIDELTRIMTEERPL